MTICHNNPEDVEIELCKKVIETLDKCPNNENIVVYSWNGSRFDNWIIFKLLKAKYNKKLWGS